MSGLAADYADANRTKLANFFIEKFNLVGREAEYDFRTPTLTYISKDTESLKSAAGFYEALKIAKANAGGPGWGTGNTYHFTNSSVRWHVEKPYAQYARMTFDNLLLAQTPTATLLDLQESESEDVKQNMLTTLEFECWNDGTGMRGQIDTLGGSEATRVLTLKDPTTVYNFPHNMVFQGNTQADGAGTLHTDQYRVTELDPVAGQITAVQLTNTGGQELADEDYLFAYGSAANYMPGIPTFIPSSAPSDTLFGVVRTGDPAKSGWRFAFKASISYTIQFAFATMGRWVSPEKKYVVCLSTMDWLALSQEREGRVIEDPGAMQKWGVDGLMVRTPFGPITCIAIPQLGDGRGYIIDWSSWTLYTLGNLPHVAMEDGHVFQRLGIVEPSGSAHPVTDGDGIEMRLRIWKVLLCKRPMSNATFPTHA